MSENDSHYFYILHQVEFDLEIFHDDLLNATKKTMDYWLETWFNRRSNSTGNRRIPSEDLKKGVFEWKERERELEEE